MLNPKILLVQRHEEDLQQETVNRDMLPNTLRSNVAVSTRQGTSDQNNEKEGLEDPALQDDKMLQEECYCLQNENKKLKSLLKLEQKQHMEQIQKLSADNEKKTASINDLEAKIISQIKEIEELQVKKKEHDMLLENTRQSCNELFSLRVDRKFVEKNSHLITEVQKLYNSKSHLDKYQHCPAMVYMKSVQDPEISETFTINESDNEPPSKKMKTDVNIRNISYTQKFLKELVMDLESRHCENNDLWKNVLWALSTCGHDNGYDTLDIANDFSKRSSKYKNFEDVKKTFESSDGTMSLQYLIEISKVYEEDLDNMERYLRTLVPGKYLPLTLTQMDCRDSSKLRLTVECSDASYELFIIPHLCVLTDDKGVRLSFLTSKISSCSSTLMSLCPEMMDGFTVTLQEDDYVFKSKTHSVQLIYHNPLDSENAFVTFPNDLRRKKTRDLRCIYKALQKETMKLLSIKSGKKIANDDNYVIDINNKNFGTTRDDTQLLQALYAAKPNIKTRYCHSGNKIYYCHPERNVWGVISHKKLDVQLRVYFINLAELNLTQAELKHINKQRSIAKIRNIILGEVDNTDFPNRLNSKIHLFITDNKTIDTSSIPPIIRHIEIEDLAKTTCGWSYNSELAVKYKEAVQSYFNTMFPEQSERDWFLSFIARFLNGNRMDEPFLILTDEHEGKTGKTTLAKLLKAVFGSYFLHNSKIIKAGESRSNNEYTGALQCLNEKRLLLASGLQKTDTLNCGFIKAITDDSNYYIKHLNKVSQIEFEFVVQAGLVIVANENNMPKFDKKDEIFVKKMAVCPLRSRFVTEEEFQEMRRNNKNKMINIHIADDSFQLHFHEWRSAILDLLIEYCNKSISMIPDSMKVWKKHLCDMSIDYSDWLSSHLLMSETSNEYISAKQIMFRIRGSGKNAHPREMQRLKLSMKDWATKNKFEYKDRHTVQGPKKKREETKSVIMNATLDNVTEILID